MVEVADGMCPHTYAEGLDLRPWSRPRVGDLPGVVLGTEHIGGAVPVEVGDDGAGEAAVGHVGSRADRPPASPRGTVMRGERDLPTTVGPHTDGIRRFVMVEVAEGQAFDGNAELLDHLPWVAARVGDLPDSAIQPQDIGGTVPVEIGDGIVSNTTL